MKRLRFFKLAMLASFGLLLAMGLTTPRMPINAGHLQPTLDSEVPG